MPSDWENLRRVIARLVALIVAICLIGGGLFFYSIRQDELAHARIQMAIVHDGLAQHMNFTFKEYSRAAANLAGPANIRRALLVGDAVEIEAANQTLDLFRMNLDVEVCYLIDRQGLVLASSNRNDADSFVGKSYAFRPYFTEALAGRPTVYPAQGVTSGRAGIYFSHPVSGAVATAPPGVVVIKIGTGIMEEHLAPAVGNSALADADGMVLLSNRADWRLRPLWDPPEETRKRWEQSRQFGTGPWRGLGFKRTGAGTVVDAAGAGYRILESPFAELPGWRLMIFFDQSSLARAVRSQVAVPGGIILVLCLSLSGLGWYFLSWGRREMQDHIALETSREALIVELRETLAQVKTLSGLLPICARCKKIRDDRGYWQQVETYVHDHTDARFTHGICPECAALLFPGVNPSASPPAGDGKAAP